MPAKKILLAMTAVVIAASPAAHAQTDGALAYETVSLRIKLCREIYRSGALRATDRASAEAGYREYLKCKSVATEAAKQAYADLNRTLKGASAKKALKNYHAALMASLGSSEPRDGELENDHRRRVSALDDKAEAAWQILQLEM